MPLEETSGPIFMKFDVNMSYVIIGFLNHFFEFRRLKCSDHFKGPSPHGNTPILIHNPVNQLVVAQGIFTTNFIRFGPLVSSGGICGSKIYNSIFDSIFDNSKT